MKPKLPFTCLSQVNNYFYPFSFCFILSQVVRIAIERLLPNSYCTMCLPLQEVSPQEARLSFLLFSLLSGTHRALSACSFCIISPFLEGLPPCALLFSDHQIISAHLFFQVSTEHCRIDKMCRKRNKKETLNFTNVAFQCFLGELLTFNTQHPLCSIFESIFS